MESKKIKIQISVFYKKKLYIFPQPLYFNYIKSFFFSVKISGSLFFSFSQFPRQEIILRQSLATEGQGRGRGGVCGGLDMNPVCQLNVIYRIS